MKKRPRTARPLAPKSKPARYTSKAHRLERDENAAAPPARRHPRSK